MNEKEIIVFGSVKIMDDFDIFFSHGIVVLADQQKKNYNGISVNEMLIIGDLR
ncbi:MAG: hypothetical protein Q7U36_00855 [bacterium]|nr:hypothetical protein [bacterium]